jgi:ribosomal protein L7/L12
MSDDNPELTRFKTILVTITLEHPAMPLHEALLLAADLEQKVREARPVVQAATLESVMNPGPEGTIEELAMFAVTQPRIVDFMSVDKKIHAIKELRAVTGCGLKNAKDAILVAWPGTPWVPRPTTTF